MFTQTYTPFIRVVTDKGEKITMNVHQIGYIKERADGKVVVRVCDVDYHLDQSVGEDFMRQFNDLTEGVPA